MKPGDRVETPDGPGVLIQFRKVMRRPFRYGRWVTDWRPWVRLTDGRVRVYEPGQVHPTLPR